MVPKRATVWNNLQRPALHHGCTSWMQPQPPLPTQALSPAAGKATPWPSWKTTLFLPPQWNIPVNGLFNYFQTDMHAQCFITLAILPWKQRLHFASNASCQSSMLTPFSRVKSAKWQHSLCSKKRANQIELKYVHFKQHQCAVNSFIGMKLEQHFQRLNKRRAHLHVWNITVCDFKQILQVMRNLYTSLFGKYNFFPIVDTQGQERSEKK